MQIAKQDAEARDWSWVEASVWTDRMLSALDNGVKGGVWYSVMDKVYAPATLAAAWAKVQANGGAAGVDRQSIERFAAHADEYVAELSRALRAGDYRPAAIRRVEIPKGNGGMRPLGIPTVKDRIAQTAVKFVLEPILEARFHPASFGFRPGRGAKDALRVVDREGKILETVASSGWSCSQIGWRNERFLVFRRPTYCASGRPGI